MSDKDLVVPRFFIHTIEDKKASQKEGRPIFKDIECVEIRTAANKQTLAVFPAHEVWQIGDIDGIRQEITYAMRFPEQYKRFKAGSAQAMEGTPIEELPFLTQAKRHELKALSIYTAETLAALDGNALKQLGMGGRDLKTQAQAYLDVAKGSAGNAELLRRLAAVEAENKALREKVAPTAECASPFEQMEADDIKNWIEEATGERPKGNPSHATLVKRADEVNAELKQKAAA
jgi:hypothetical protein